MGVKGVKPLQIVTIPSDNGTAAVAGRGPTCGGCRHWDAEEAPRDQRGVQVGKCRRNPPAVVGTFFPMQAQGVLQRPNEQAVRFHLQTGTIWFTPAADEKACGEWDAPASAVSEASLPKKHVMQVVSCDGSRPSSDMIGVEMPE